MLTAISMSAIATNGVVPGNVDQLPAVGINITAFDQSLFSTVTQYINFS